MDEADIRQELAAGRHREAFERIVDRFQQKVFHLALSMTRHEATAADLAQESLLRVWKALPAYDGRASLSTWIYTITRNACLTELARAARRPAVSLDAPESAGTLESLAAPEPAGAGAGSDLAALLDRLPDKYRQVLRLFHLEGRSGEETAALLGQPLGTVKTNLFRARKELARLAARAGATH
ncbi:MAG TPA: sigma-70 family RNA polymerase sigma factor [Verrucomicrobiota bacterium]|nr:sigma-70 family RNA polymerase sigma factor [Verrucomicrobiota bacterium]